MNREELIVLLRSWQDYVPLPPTWTGELQRRSVARGPAPFRWLECADCEGLGRRRGGKWVCMRCKGKGGFEIDAYTEQAVDTEETPWGDLLGRTVNCDTCGGHGYLGAFAAERPDPKTHQLCPACEGACKVPALFSRRLADLETARPRQGDRVLDALSDQDERRDATSVYRDHLLPAMDELRQRAPGTHSLVCWVYVLEAQQPSRLNERALELGLAFLLRQLEHVRTPPLARRQVALHAAALVRAKGKGADKKAQGVRNLEIRRRRGEGAKIAELAEDFQLDKGQVSRIVNGAGP